MTLPRPCMTASFLALLILLATSTPVMGQAVPTNVSASDGLWDTRVRVDWDTTHTTGVHVVTRSTSVNGTYAFLANVYHPDTWYNDTSAVTGQTYYYKVRSCFSESNCSSYSSPDSGWRGYLNTVTTINATDSTTSDGIWVIFSSVTNADFYKVLRSRTVDGNKTEVGSPTSTLFLDDQATPNTTYYYWVVACNNTGINQCGQAHQYDTGKRTWPVVQNVAASDGGHPSFVRVTWDAISGANFYKVHFALADGAPWLSVETTGNTTSYDYYLPISYAGVDRAFAVEACHDDTDTGPNCNTTKSESDVGWPDYPAPENVSATDGTGANNTVVTWDEVDSDAKYYVHRDETNSPDGVEYAGTEGFAEFFVDDYSKGALPGTDYRYWVGACPSSAVSWDGKGCSAYSASDRGYYLPGKINTITASDGTSPSHVQVDWQAVDGATTYVVERSEDPFAEPPVWTVLDTIGTNSYLDASAIEGVTYWYSARACGADYCGPDGRSDVGWLQGTETCNVEIVSDHFAGGMSLDYEACEILVVGPNFTATSNSDVSLSSGWEIGFEGEFRIDQGTTLEVNVCGQSLCMTSDAPMPYGCHSCVDLICDDMPGCCTSGFDQACLDEVGAKCGLVCE